ncbi:hypothetical protein GCU60_06310 [Blastococcus saxobsidens]|uniref:Uncharacterized protein n=1 Tax=Blastococcus saxobsidens TaxID=138336 RepID=A0A6L9VZX6_9ACTN|nr:hypothetical protein [Blastococcus saxobsidens]NEK85376.1 hypothetical protein [Blastococcus saxobsidens]
MVDRAARVVSGHARVVREVRAAGPLMARLSAPVTARGPWLTAVLNEGAARTPRLRPVAVVVDDAPGDAPGEAPRAAAFLALRRRGLSTVVELLGQSRTPLPGGRPPARLLARDQAAAGQLADGVLQLLGSLRGPRSVRLAGLPLGDPTAAALAARLPTSVLGNARSTRLVDVLDDVGPVQRSRDPRVLERVLPALLAAVPDRRTGDFLRATARLHAALGQLEVAVAGTGPAPGVLLTLVDGTDRWPWWSTDEAGLRTEMGAPVVSLTVPARVGSPLPGLSRRRAR